MELRHILLKTPLLVESMMKSLEQGADFAQIARDHSACPSKSNGGALGVTDPSELPKSLQVALETSQIGDVIGPVESRHGIHIIKVESSL